VALGNQVAQSRFHDRASACLHRFHFAGTKVDANDLIALMREARGAYGSDITQSKNANPAHFEVFSLVAMRALPRIQISRQVLSRN
jgi:hypothetical protein